MQIAAINTSAMQANPSQAAASYKRLSEQGRQLTGQATGEADGGDNKLRKAFDNFVGETFYGQMLSSMRKTQDKPAYFHGGRAEEVFRGQLDQMLATKMTEASADKISGPMFQLFQLQRS